jgi:hypothetical protein
MPASSTSIVLIGRKACRPFLIEVMVFSPESGFKFKVVVERSCTPAADEIWKLVFDLFKVSGASEVQVVHVSFTTGTRPEQRAVQRMVSEGIKPAQADVLVADVYPAAKDVIGKKPTASQKRRLHDSMARVVSVRV